MPEIVDVTPENWQALDQELEVGQELVQTLGQVVAANVETTKEMDSFYRGLLNMYERSQILDNLLAHVDLLNQQRENPKFPKEYLAQKVEALGPMIDQIIGIYKAVVEPYEQRLFNKTQVLLTQIEESKQSKVGKVGDINRAYGELKGWRDGFRGDP